jgi:hypothetical protein
VTEVRRRIDVVLEPDYLDGLEERPVEEVRLLHEQCLALETEVSYVRRLAQARIAIIHAEQERRATGGSVADLVAALPTILADHGPRPDPASSRLTRHLAPAPAIEWTRGRESLITDETLVNLPTLSDEELVAALDELGELEREVSERRRSLHGVVDRIESDLARRRVST